MLYLIQVKDNHTTHPAGMRWEKGKNMRLIDFLKVTDTNTFITVKITIHEFLFETRHSVEFFLKK